MEKLRGFYSSYKNALDKPQPLTEIDMPCDAVMLSLWTITDDLKDAPIMPYTPPPPGEALSGGTPSLIYYGFGGQTVHELAPGATTELVYCSNARDIFVRALKNTPTRVYFSCFKSEEEKV
ncbi:MAG: hypothetical protein ACR2MG_20850 [Pyrinomonadaceae bacterium]